MRKEVENWLEQSLDDFDTAQKNLTIKKYHVVVFYCQQAVEKGLKAILIKEQEILPRTHSVVRLAKSIKVPRLLLEKIASLEPVYQETRYPDVSQTIPAKEFSKDESEEFLTITNEVIEWIQKRISS